jgi:hypothetical protein
MDHDAARNHLHIAERRAPWVTAFVSLAGAASAAMVTYAWMVLYVRHATGPRFSGPGPLEGLMLLVLASLLFTTVAGVAWLVWFWALHGAVAAMGGTRHGSAWAVLAWIVYGVNLVLPKRMVDDVWHAGGERSAPPWPVRVWWGLWVTAGAAQLLRLVMGLTLGSSTGSDAVGTAEAYVSGIAMAALLLATPFAVITVRCLTTQVRAAYDAATAGRDALVGAAP